MTANETTTITARSTAGGQLTSGDGAAAEGVLAAVWWRSVGTSWTLELHDLDGGTACGRIVDWISSGIPISQSEPDALARELLAERGLALFGDCSVGPCTHSRRGIGYVTGDAELITLARLMAAEAGVHPVALAAQWVAGRVPRRRCRRIDTPGDLFTTGGPAPGGAFAAHRLAD